MYIEYITRYDGIKGFEYKCNECGTKQTKMVRFQKDVTEKNDFWVCPLCIEKASYLLRNS
jgi:predicted SprT family Zn-dependent metalloprotease